MISSMNQCEALYEPNKQDSTAAKGMAILAMAFLHLFCRTENLPYTPLAVIGKTPLIYYFGLFGDICVPVYCFISGYAQYLLREKEGKSFCKSIIKRLAKFYLGYLVVLILFTLIGLMSGSETIPVSFEKFIGNLFLAGMSYNGAWWFVLTYIFLVLLSPLLTGISKKTNPFLLISVSGAAYLAAYIFRFVHVISLPGKILPWIFTQLLLIGTSQFSFIAGMIFFRFKMISRIKDFCLRKHILIPVCITVPIIMFLSHCLVQSLIIAPITGISVLICFYICPLPSVIKKLFLFFGKHSTNIWLTHMFFYMEPFEGLVFKARYTIPSFFLMLLFCIMTSYIIKSILFAANKIFSRGKEKPCRL